MKILVLSGTPWNNNNSFGLSYSNIFKDIPNLEFANIYCSSGSPNNEFEMQCFQITYGDLVKNLKNKKNPIGRVVINNSNIGVKKPKGEEQRYNVARKLRWQILFWARDFIWKIGRWKSPELIEFIDEFHPDVIFQPVYFSSYLNDIVNFIKKHTNVPMVGYISDDNYTLRQFRFSPLYWIDRLWKRRKVKRTIEQCEILYVISEIQKREYQKIFTPPCKVLTKCVDFGEGNLLQKVNNPIKIIYAGNMDAGRTKSLLLLAQAVSSLNQEGYNVIFDIFSGTPLKKKRVKGFHKCINCNLNSAIPYVDLIKLQKEADVLVHAEGLSLKSRLEVHQSFSTKLVDYFELGKCIFAIGPSDVASISHLEQNDAAIVANSKQKVYEKLKQLLDNPNLIIEYGKKSYECGEQNHNKNTMQTMLIDDLYKITGKSI